VRFEPSVVVIDSDGNKSPVSKGRLHEAYATRATPTTIGTKLSALRPLPRPNAVRMWQEAEHAPRTCSLRRAAASRELHALGIIADGPHDVFCYQISIHGGSR